MSSLQQDHQMEVAVALRCQRGQGKPNISNRRDSRAGSNSQNRRRRSRGQSFPPG
jgi:hypothetical protein